MSERVTVKKKAVNQAGCVRGGSPFTCFLDAIDFTLYRRAAKRDKRYRTKVRTRSLIKYYYTVINVNVEITLWYLGRL